jgi:hypothetical protein
MHSSQPNLFSGLSFAQEGFRAIGFGQGGACRTLSTRATCRSHGVRTVRMCPYTTSAEARWPGGWLARIPTAGARGTRSNAGCPPRSGVRPATPFIRARAIGCGTRPASALSPIPGSRYLQPNVWIGIGAKSMVPIAVTAIRAVRTAVEAIIRADVQAIRADIGIRPDHDRLGECWRSCGYDARTHAGEQCSSDDICHFRLRFPNLDIRVLTRWQGRCPRQSAVRLRMTH